MIKLVNKKTQDTLLELPEDTPDFYIDFAKEALQKHERDCELKQYWEVEVIYQNEEEAPNLTAEITQVVCDLFSHHVRVSAATEVSDKYWYKYTLPNGSTWDIRRIAKLAQDGRLVVSLRQKGCPGCQAIDCEGCEELKEKGCDK